MNLLRLLVLFVCVVWAVRYLRAILDDPRFQPPRAPPRPRSAPPPRREPTPYEVLGVAPGATREQVREAYHKLVAQYHPDQVSHLGPELREVAERRTKEITAAYNALKRT